MSAEKILAMIPAGLLTIADMHNVGNPLPIDETIQNADERRENLQTWEVFRINYAAVCGALADDKNWPAPQLAAGSLATSIGTKITSGLLPLVDNALNVPGVQSVLSGIPYVGLILPLVKTWLDNAVKTQSPSPAPVTPTLTGTIPDPGAPAVPVVQAAK